MPICDKCGWKTNSDRIFKIHQNECAAEPVEITEAVKAKPVSDKPDYEEMTNSELKDILTDMNITLPRPANKANLIQAINDYGEDSV